MNAATEPTVMQYARLVAEYAAAALEIAGIAVIVLLALYAIGRAGTMLLGRVDHSEIFRHFRHHLAGGILLGLEFLIAADIIHTVAVDLTFTSVGSLAIIVAIRTFLSFTLEVEMTGHWPWQNPPAKTEQKDRA